MFLNNNDDGANVEVYKYMQKQVYDINTINNVDIEGICPNKLNIVRKNSINKHIDDAVNFILGDKRKNESKEDSTEEKKQKIFDDNEEYLNLDNVYIELQKNKIINRYRIIHNFQFKIEILLSLYQINLVQNPGYISVYLTDKNNKQIQIDDINFSVSHKDFYYMNLLLKEITNIINFNYNINCYYYLKDVEQELKSYNIKTKNIFGKLYVILNVNNQEIQFNLSFPYNHLGNRGISYCDPVNPSVIKVSLINMNINQIRNILGIDYNTIFFRSSQNMILFFTNFFEKLIKNINNNLEIINLDEELEDLEDSEYYEYLEYLKYNK